MSIQGKIAQIVDASRVVLNIGAREGVQVNQVYLIFQEGDEVFDPDTKESLGKIEIPKGKVVIEHVQEKMSFASTPKKNETQLEKAKTLSEMMVEASTPLAVQHELLEADPYSLKPLPAITPVKVGDLVRQIIEVEG